MVTTSTLCRAGTPIGPERMLTERLPARRPARMRLEWNGLAGVRQIRIEMTPPAETATCRDRCEHLMGEVSEPLS